MSATDVRPATKEQVESLGAKFIAVEDEEFKQAETSGGYAKEMSAEYKAKQAELVANHVTAQDIVITTALIPGRPAPKLISKAMIESMKPGSIIVDLAAERGGNVELTQPGKVVTTGNGVTVVGYTNVPGRLATSASQLYARNLIAFVETLIDKKTQALAVDWDDELVKATVLTRDGIVVHPNIKLAPAAAAPKAAAAAKAAPVKAGSAGKASSAAPKAAAKKTPVAAAVPVKAGAAKSTAAKAPAVAKTPAVTKTAAVAKAPAVAKPPVAAKPAAAAKKPAATKPAAKGTK